MQAYLDADYRWELHGRWLPVSIGEPAPEVEQAYPQATRFGLLSAWNPHSIERPEPDNRADDEAMQEALQASGHAFRAGFASASNRSWREPSWVVVDMPLAELDAMGRRFGQLGVLYWQRGEPVRLRMLATRPADFAGHADTKHADAKHTSAEHASAKLACVDWVD